MFRAIPHAALALGALTFSMMLAGSARAQYPFSPYGYSYPYYGGVQASTVGQANAMGMADLVGAVGANHLLNSEAAINYEQARSQNLDNRLKGTQTYFEMRKINTASRNAERTRGLTTEEAWRYAQAAAPKRTTPNELDPVTGKIYWPMQLENPKYDEYRKQLDELFRQRETAHGSIGYQVYTKIQDTTNALLADLKKNIGDFSSGDYVNAKGFVESLAYESRFPTA